MTKAQFKVTVRGPLLEEPFSGPVLVVSLWFDGEKKYAYVKTETESKKEFKLRILTTLKNLVGAWEAEIGNK
jgi:hypothetical protein